MKVCNIDRAKALAKNVIPREGVERLFDAVKELQLDSVSDPERGS